MDRRISSKMFDLEVLERYSNRPAVMWFYFVVLASIYHSSLLQVQLGIHLDIQVKRFVHLMTNIMTVQQQYISLLVGLSMACESWSSKSVGILALSRLNSSRNSGFSSRVGTLLPIIWDSWTLCAGFREVRGHAPQEKIRDLRSSNCWKCIEIVNPTTTTLFLYHFKSFTIRLGGPFWLLGRGVRAHPAHPLPCLRAWQSAADLALSTKYCKVL